MKNISGAKILITGGMGFIGSNLAEKLVENGARVTILDAMIAPYGGNEFNLERFRSKIDLIEGDIRSEEAVKKAVNGKDLVFHLAGQTGRIISMEDPVLDTEINCLGTLNILDAIRKEVNKPKIIFAGSRGVIGKPNYLPVDEKHQENPKDIYGINKLTAERYCFLFGSDYGFRATSLRLNNVYGPKCQIKSNHYGTLNLFVAYALQGKVLPIYGDGKQTRDYIYISDVVDAFVKAMSPKADGQFFFVGTGKATSLIDIVKMIKKKIPSTKSEICPFPEALKSVDFPDFYSTSEKIEKVLSWKPVVSLEDGIKKTADFYKKHLKHYL